MHQAKAICQRQEHKPRGFMQRTHRSTPGAVQTLWEAAELCTCTQLKTRLVCSSSALPFFVQVKVCQCLGRGLLMCPTNTSAKECLDKCNPPRPPALLLWTTLSHGSNTLLCFGGTKRTSPAWPQQRPFFCCSHQLQVCSWRE